MPQPNKLKLARAPRAPWFVIACMLAAACSKPPPARPLVPVPAPTEGEFVVLTDTRGGYYAAKHGAELLYYGDAKTLWKQRVGAFASNADEGTWDLGFWSPRVANLAKVEATAGGTYALTCGQGAPVPLKKLPAAEANAFLASAKLENEFWKRQAQALARDDDGVYYFVDRLQNEHGGKGHRVFVGQKGAMKELPMTNVVADAEGEIYATKSGELRLISSRNTAVWIRNGKAARLVQLVPAENVTVIYTDLGVYPGSLGTPCDDFDAHAK